MAQVGNRKFWRVATDLESLTQLRHDVHDTLGRLLTKCHEFARLDPSCAGYWTGEATYWEGQYREALALIDSMINASAMRRTPVREQVGHQTIEISNIGGDVVITTVDGSTNVAAGKGITQDVNSFPGKHEEDQ